MTNEKSKSKEQESSGKNDMISESIFKLASKESLTKKDELKKSNNYASPKTIPSTKRKEKSKSSDQKLEMVSLNVYSLEKVNKNIAYTGLGIYHTGVQVYDREWAYGGHPYSMSGIFQMVKPRDLKSLSEMEGNFLFYQTIDIGKTKYSLPQVLNLLSQIKEEWKGNQYHLLYKNCNNFSDKLCLTLTGRSIPTWINRIASITTLMPHVVMLIPKEYLTPPALENEIHRQRKATKLGEIKIKTFKIKSLYPKSDNPNFTKKLSSSKENLYEFHKKSKGKLPKFDLQKIPKSNSSENMSASELNCDKSTACKRSPKDIEYNTTINCDNNLKDYDDPKSKNMFAQVHLSKMLALSEELRKKRD